MTDFRSWAHRRQSRGGHQAQQQTELAPPSAPAPRTLPLPPEGYAWGMHGGQYVLIPLATPASAPSVQPLRPPIRQPSGVVPFSRQHFASAIPPAAPSKAIETCTLVKPGDRDTYAEMMEQVPDIVPDNSPYDAMAGNPSPATAAEMAGVTEFATIVNPGPDEQGGARSFLPGAVLAKGSVPLRGAG
jgi:hypothetical protein